MVLQRHYFFALSLPEEIKLKLKEYCNQLKNSYPFARWVHEQDYHITLAFLGQASKEQLNQATVLVGQNLHDSHSFSLTIDALGIFGRKETPRIFFGGVQREEMLQEVRNQVFKACLAAGFQLETRPFHPHITFARKWQGDEQFPFATFEVEKRLVTTLTFQAKEIVLYESHLDREPKYEAIKTFTLNN